MNRLAAVIVAVIALVAAGCGDDGGFEDQAGDLGYSDAETECLQTALEADDVPLAALAADSDDSPWADQVDDALADCVDDTDEQAAPDTDDDGNDTDPSDDGDDDSRDDTDPGDDTDDRSAVEEAFIQGMVESGLSQEASECLFDALQDQGLDVGDLLELGLEASGPEIPPELFSATFECIGEGFDFGSGLGDEDFDFGDDDFDFDLDLDSDADTYGDDPELDALWDGCAGGDAGACDELYLRSPFGSEYERFASTCGDTRPEFTFCEQSQSS